MSTSSSTTIEAAHHFKDLDHQHDSGKLGVWLFLATEILMFGGLIVGYIIMHGIYPDLFAVGAKQLDWRLGALNTVILLVSSFTMAAGVYSAQTNQIKKCINYLIVTILCGFGFLGVKYIEYSAKLSHGMAPGGFFNYEEVAAYSSSIGQMMEPFGQNMGMYFGFYFCMTGLHASHVILGMGLIGWVALRAKRGEFNDKHYTAVEGVGLFWHLVDLIWIYLFPLLYLVG